MEHINTKDCILPWVVPRSNVELTATLVTSDESPADWSDGKVVEGRVSVEGGRGCVEGRRSCVAGAAETTPEDVSIVTAGVVTGALNGGLVVTTEAPLVSCGLKLVTTDVIPELGVACSRDDGAISVTVLEGVTTPPRLDIPTPEEMDAIASIPSSTTLDV